jgi:hypothetical protein
MQAILLSPRILGLSETGCSTGSAGGEVLGGRANIRRKLRRTFGNHAFARRWSDSAPFWRRLYGFGSCDEELSENSGIAANLLRRQSEPNRFFYSLGEDFFRSERVQADPSGAD